MSFISRFPYYAEVILGGNQQFDPRPEQFIVIDQNNPYAGTLRLRESIPLFHPARDRNWFHRSLLNLSTRDYKRIIN